MSEIRSDLDLAHEAFGAERSRELGTQNLDGYSTTMFDILGEIDRRHPACAQLALDAVAVGEGYREAAGEISHARTVVARPTVLLFALIVPSCSGSASATRAASRTPRRSPMPGHS
jgi:hypothetical protein